MNIILLDSFIIIFDNIMIKNEKKNNIPKPYS